MTDALQSTEKLATVLIIYRDAVVVSESRQLNPPSVKQLSKNFMLIVSDIPTNIREHSLWIDADKSVGISSYQVKSVDLAKLDGYSSKLLTRLVGHQVEVCSLIKEDSISKELKHRGTLKSIDRDMRAVTLYNTDGSSVKIIDGNIHCITSSNAEFNRVTLVPTIVMQAHLLEDSLSAGTFKIGYTAGGVYWKASYTITVSPDENSMSLYGKLAIKNETEANFPASTVSIVDGELFSSTPPTQYDDVDSAEEEYEVIPREMRRREPQRLAAVPTMKKHDTAIVSHSYNKYAVDELIEIDSSSDTHYAGFFHMEDIPIKKLFVYDTQLPDSVYTVLQWSNAADKGGPGNPLPAGIYSVYQQQTDNDYRELIGEIAFPQIVPDIDTEMHVGKVSNIHVHRDVVDTSDGYDKKMKSKYYRYVIESTVTNYKKTAIVITLIEHFKGKSGYVTTEKTEKRWKIRQHIPNTRQDDLETAFEHFMIPAMTEDNKSGVRKIRYVLTSYDAAVIQPSSAQPVRSCPLKPTDMYY